MEKERKKAWINFEELILWEDEHLIAINKPREMASLEDKQALNVQTLARRYDPKLSLCHRLDKYTSGTLLLSRNEEVYREMALLFQHRKIEKTYLALVRGIHHYEDYEIDLPLLITSNKKVSVNKKLGKLSKTIVNPDHHFRRFTMLRCQPVTGRMHQIRVHLAAVGTPIVGDDIYGGADLYLSDLKRNYKPSNRKEELPLNRGFLLHASSISFTHPMTGEQLSIEAELPKNFKVVIRNLEKYKG